MVIMENTAWLVEGEPYICEPTDYNARGWRIITKAALCAMRTAVLRLWHPSHTGGMKRFMPPPIIENDKWLVMRVVDVEDGCPRTLCTLAATPEDMLWFAAGNASNDLRLGHFNEQRDASAYALCLVEQVNSWAWAPCRTFLNQTGAQSVTPEENNRAQEQRLHIAHERNKVVAQHYTKAGMVRVARGDGDEFVMTVHKAYVVYGSDVLCVVGRVLGLGGLTDPLALDVNVMHMLTAGPGHVLTVENYLSKERDAALKTNAHWDPYQ